MVADGKLSGLPGDFFQHLRQLVVLGYYTSEIGCKQERVYVPGSKLPSMSELGYPMDGP